ncbi:S9 family peptidase [Dasania marina]|uniref:S9 family peptidase n=1 Tax=Dasania marina TaxID=471499 RepID=UPI0004B30897|nr:S9 family peptidase [Dasania marina]
MNKIILCLAASLLCTSASWAKAEPRAEPSEEAGSLRAMQIADLNRLADVSAPNFSPDGSQLVYVVNKVNSELDKYHSDLWVVPYQGGKAKPLTTTKERSEWAPQYSPNGKHIAFLSSDKEDESTQVFMMKAGGGSVKQLTHIVGGVIAFDWAPDSQRLVVSAWANIQQPNKAGTAPPIVIDRFQFMLDEVGYLTTQRSHLFIVNSKNKKTTTLLAGNQDYWMPTWSPDGQWIAYVTKDPNKTSLDADRHADSDVFIVQAKAGASPQRISHDSATDVDPYWASPPQWSPDSQQLVWLTSNESKWFFYAPSQLSVADISTKKVRQLARIDRFFYLPKWSADGQSIYALIEQDRYTSLAKIDAASGSINYLNKGEHFSLDYDISGNGQIALLNSNTQRPFELMALDKGMRPLSHHNDWLQDLQLANTQAFSFNNNGHEIGGLLMLPAGYQAGQAVPTIFRVHGGPVYQFSYEFMSDWQIYAAKGYAVVGINPRGSSGKGFDYSKAIYADWGNVDTSDILAGSDYLIEQGIVDKNRMGIGGWSYGSMLSNYVIATDTRFKAAVSGAGTANIFGTYGHDQYSREYEYELGTPWHNSEIYQRVSFPFLQAHKITTPTLYQCSEKDFNVPCLGAEQMYQALKSLQVDTQLVIYPGQYHSITVPSYLIDRMQRNVAWYDKYLRH